jgi:hypothetical protein
MPTKRKRHMITETAEIEAAIEPLRMRGIRVSFPDLVIKGAKAAVDEARRMEGDEEHRRAARERFIEWTQAGAPGLDLDLDRSGWKRPSVEKLLDEL